jgi:hypothetical protein
MSMRRLVAGIGYEPGITAFATLEYALSSPWAFTSVAS